MFYMKRQKTPPESEFVARGLLGDLDANLGVVDRFRGHGSHVASVSESGDLLHHLVA